MSTEPQQTPESSASAPPAATPPPALKHPPIAPIWNTVLIVALIIGNSFIGSAKLETVHSTASRLLLYASTFITQFVLIAIIWFGLRLRGVKMRDVIGGRWAKVEDFLLDIGIALAFWIVSLLLLFAIRVALGTIDLHNLEQSKNDAIRMIGPLAPHSYLEVVFFLVLSVSAGLFEEIIFRGYLQRQFNALFRNAAAGIVASGIVFGLAHRYQGNRMMIALGAFGIFFGLLAHFRRSLRPGMIAHAFQDSVAGIALFKFVR